MHSLEEKRASVDWKSLKLISKRSIQRILILNTKIYVMRSLSTRQIERNAGYRLIPSLKFERSSVSWPISRALSQALDRVQSKASIAISKNRSIVFTTIYVQ